MSTFSERHGFVRPKDIKYREDVPEHLRRPICDILVEAVRAKVLVDAAHRLFDPYGLGSLPGYGFPVIGGTEDDATEEFKRIVQGCTWFQTFDVIEDTIKSLDFYE